VETLPMSYGDYSMVEHGIAPDLAYEDGQDTPFPMANFRDIISPPPGPILDPQHPFSYPLSPVWTLVKDQRYSSHFFYSADRSTHSQDLEKECQSLIQLGNPQGCSAAWNPIKKLWESSPIQGMVQMIPGVSFAYKLDERQGFVRYGPGHSSKKMAVGRSHYQTGAKGW
ncbi:hypothetical protein AX14_006069, partial [Amanita brunnescens Koide BX004]